MKNVSFETAKALRDAGFPQPEPAFGQQWYFPETKELFLVTFVYSNGKVDYCMEGSQVVMLEDMPEGAIFAPQAHDILAQLPDGMWNLSKGKGFWHVLIEVFERILESDKSPHETAAQAYLQLHKPA